MDHDAALASLSALSHAGRLSAFRLLARHAPRSMAPAQVDAALGLAPGTAADHLGTLADAGLVRCTGSGADTACSVDFHRAGALVAFLVGDCGRNRPELTSGIETDPLPFPSDRVLVLFLCEHNSARSLIAEALLRDRGEGLFRVCSAGISPAAAAEPEALRVLAEHGHDISMLRPKPVAELFGPGGPRPHFVFTVCDRAADADLPTWPGRPLMAHWGVANPCRATGPAEARRAAFDRAYAALDRRIEAFLAVPPAGLGRAALQARLDAIGLIPGPVTMPQHLEALRGA